jgi:FlaG/FlaF family flagellin (archaellin)
MARHGRTTDERGVSEFAGVAILITMTILVTASVGMFVLVSDTEDTEGPPDANFTFQYFSDSSSVIITFERGEEIAAQNITVQGREASATWAQLARMNGSRTVGPGAAVQISRRNAYGESVARDDRIRIIYSGLNGTTAKLDSWNDN